MRLKKHIIEWEVGGFAMMSIKEAEKITGITNQNIRYYEKQGLGRKEAMKQVAKDRGVGKREIYQALLEAD